MRPPYPERSGRPGDRDPFLDRQRKPRGLLFHGVTFGPREAPPRLDRQLVLVAPPDARYFTAQQHRSRPHSGGPQRASVFGATDEQLSVGTPQEIERVTARQQARGRHRPGDRPAKRLLIGAEDPSV